MDEITLFQYLKKLKTLDPENPEDFEIIKKAYKRFGGIAIRVTLRGKTFSPEQKIYILDRLCRQYSSVVPNHWGVIVKLFKTPQEAFLLAQWILSNHKFVRLPKRIPYHKKLTLAIAFPKEKYRIMQS